MKTALKRIIAAVAVFGALSALCYSCAPVKVSAADASDAETVKEWLLETSNQIDEWAASEIADLAPSQWFADWLGIYLAYTYMADADNVKPTQARAFYYRNENDEICVATAFQFSHSASYQIAHTTRPLTGSDGKFIEIVPTVSPSMPSSYFPSSGYYMGASPGGDPFQQAYTITNEKGDTRTVNTVGQSTLDGYTQYSYYYGTPSVTEFPIYNTGSEYTSPLGRYVDIGGKRWNYSGSVPISLITPGMSLDDLNTAVTNYYQTTYNFTPPSQPERKQVETLPVDDYSGLPEGWNAVDPVPLPDIETPSAPLTEAEVQDAHDWLTDFSFWASVQSGLAFWFAAAAHVAEINETLTGVLLGVSLLSVLGYVLWRWGI